MVEAVLGSKLAFDFSHEEFWTSVIQWLIGSPMLDIDQVGPIVDYIHHQKFEPQQAATAAGEPEIGPPQPNFSIKGRTPDSLLRQMRQWHVELRKQPEQADMSWYECGIGEFDWMEGTANSEDLRSLDDPGNRDSERLACRRRCHASLRCQLRACPVFRAKPQSGRWGLNEAMAAENGCSRSRWPLAEKLSARSREERTGCQRRRKWRSCVDGQHRRGWHWTMVSGHAERTRRQRPRPAGSR